MTGFVFIVELKRRQVTPEMGTPEPPMEKSKGKVAKLLELLTGTTYEGDYMKAGSSRNSSPNMNDKEYLSRARTPEPTVPEPLPKYPSSYSADFQMYFPSDKK